MRAHEGIWGCCCHFVTLKRFGPKHLLEEGERDSTDHPPPPNFPLVHSTPPLTALSPPFIANIPVLQRLPPTASPLVLPPSFLFFPLFIAVNPLFPRGTQAVRVHVRTCLSLPVRQNINAKGRGCVLGSFGAFDVYIVEQSEAIKNFSCSL